MTTKLLINLRQGIVEVDGDDALVREVYADFKAHLLSSAIAPNGGDVDSDDEGPQKAEEKPKGKQKRRVAGKGKAVAEDSSPSIAADSPKLDKNMDTSELQKFYNQFEPKNHPEKILIFLLFMTEGLGIDSPNTDQFYTCYERVNERIPKIFSQAFRDASGRKFGFIDYNSPMDIKLTTTGRNHFKFDLKKKGNE